MAGVQNLQEDEKAQQNTLDPSLMNIVSNNKLKWVFVGGKGGSGKTTVSCSVALRLAGTRKSVLLLSCDPLHSVSHSFEQTFSKTPTKVGGFDNLFVAEIDTEQANEFLPDDFFEDNVARSMGIDMKKMLSDALDSIPGVKMALVLYAEVVKMMSNPQPEFDVVVFDTASGGQTTISLDCLPDALDKLFEKSVAIRNQVLPLLCMFGQEQLTGLTPGLQEAFDRFSVILDTLKKAKLRLRSPEETTFVAVCTPDFLSVYETEQMIQQLCKHKIDCHNMIVNQYIAGEENCKTCLPKQKLQAKYIQQIHDLYEDFHIVEVPVVGEEIKGPDSLNKFSAYMFK